MYMYQLWICDSEITLLHSQNSSKSSNDLELWMYDTVRSIKTQNYSVKFVAIGYN